MDLNAILAKTGQKLSEKEADAFKSISVKDRIRFWQEIQKAGSDAAKAQTVKLFTTRLIEEKKLQAAKEAAKSDVPPPAGDENLPPPPASDEIVPPPEAGDDAVPPPSQEPDIPEYSEAMKQEEERLKREEEERIQKEEEERKKKEEEERLRLEEEEKLKKEEEERLKKEDEERLKREEEERLKQEEEERLRKEEEERLRLEEEERLRNEEKERIRREEEEEERLRKLKEEEEVRKLEEQLKKEKEEEEEAERRRLAEEEAQKQAQEQPTKIEVSPVQSESQQTSSTAQATPKRSKSVLITQDTNEIRREIETLIGKTKKWCTESEETKNFRENMKTCKTFEEGKQGTAWLPPVYLSNDPISEDIQTILATIHFIVHGSQPISTTMVAELDWKVDVFADEFFKKAKKKHDVEKPKELLFFKATGTAEYIYGDYKVIDFEYIRNCIKKGQKKIELNLMDTDTVFDEMDPYDQKLKSIVYDIKKTSDKTWNHDEISFQNRIMNSSQPVSEISALSLWDMNKPFQFKLVGVDSIQHSAEFLANFKEPSDSMLYVHIEIFHGSTLLSAPKFSSLIPYSREPRWNQSFVFDDLVLGQLPRETKICCTLYARSYSKEDAAAAAAEKGQQSTGAPSPIASSATSSEITDDDRHTIEGVTETEEVVTELSDDEGTDASDDVETIATLSGSSKRQILDADYPIGYIGVPALDFKGNLQQGVALSHLCPDECFHFYSPSVEHVNLAQPMALSIEFPSYMAPVVCPASGKIPEYLDNMYQTYERKMNAQKELTVPFSQSNTSSDGKKKAKTPEPSSPSTNSQNPTQASNSADLDTEKQIEIILETDPLHRLSPAEKFLIWKNRDKLCSIAKALPKFLLSVPWEFPTAREIACNLLEKWAKSKPIDYLELISYNFPDERVRSYACDMLDKLADNELADFFLQLVQALKFDLYHDSALARLLLQRALRSTHLLGHLLYWFLKAETHVHSVRERFSLILEEYLLVCGNHRAELLKQQFVHDHLLRIALKIKELNESKEKVDLNEALREELKKIQFPPKFKLPLNPRLEAKGIIPQSCKVMTSKKLPLWLVFENCDPNSAPIKTMFKAGDDLRQDLLSLQMMKAFDSLWKSKGYDFHMKPYGCVCTGDETGMIEIVLNSRTIADIASEKGGNILEKSLSAFSASPLKAWLEKNNKQILKLQDGQRSVWDNVVENFKLSSAGYCCATYVLGIGDRHNDNIMLQDNGNLFHIDFGHILGHKKKFMGLDREPVPFVFTSMYSAVLGGTKAQHFKGFKDYGFKAYNALRENGNMIMSLFCLCLASGMPELSSPKDILWLRKTLVLDETEEGAKKFWKKKVKKSVSGVYTMIKKTDDFLHIFKHKKKK